MQSVSQQGNALLNTSLQILYFTGQLFSTYLRHQTPLATVNMSTTHSRSWIHSCRDLYAIPRTAAKVLYLPTFRLTRLVSASSFIMHMRTNFTTSVWIRQSVSHICWRAMCRLKGLLSMSYRVPLSRSCMNNFVILRLREVQYVATSINARMWSIKTPWPLVRTRTILSAKLVPTFADRGCHVVRATDP
jgi:hypothetical protein